MKEKIVVCLILLFLLLITGCSNNKMTKQDFMECTPGDYNKFEGAKDAIDSMTIVGQTYHEFPEIAQDYLACEYIYNLKEPKLIMGSEVTGMTCYFNMGLWAEVINITITRDPDKLEFYNNLSLGLFVEYFLPEFNDCQMKYW